MKKDTALFFPDFYGNDALKRRLATDIRTGTLFHSLMLVGGAGCGKRTLAYRIAAALCCENAGAADTALPCGVCASCRKILSGNSSDILLIDRDKHETIGVDSVRGFRSDAYITSNDLDFKLYIINDVHTMTAQAQNAALKILEEPPKNVRFILLCEDTQSVLETILSRVMIFHLEPLSDPLLETALLEQLPAANAMREGNPDRFREIIRYARGSLGRAKDILGEKEPAQNALLEEYRLPSKLLDSLAFSTNRADYLALGSHLPEERRELNDFFAELALAARDLLAVKKCAQPEFLYYLTAAEAQHTASGISQSRAYRVALLARDAGDATAKNINLAVIRSKFLFELRAVFNS